jgi:hypothetical protein
VQALCPIPAQILMAVDVVRRGGYSPLSPGDCEPNDMTGSW